MLARHHTDSEHLKQIQESGFIFPARGDRIGVHVETEPFGSAVPGTGGPKAETGAIHDGAYVEFELPANALPTFIGPRHTAVIPTDLPLSLEGLSPKFVRVKQWWNLWYFWK